MASINSDQKLDVLWKRLYGVTQTDTKKSEYEELNLRREQIRASDIWRNDSDIPTTATPVDGIVEAVSVRCVAEPSVPTMSAWIAVRTFATGLTAENVLMDFIPPSFHPSYEIQVFSDAAHTNRIYNSLLKTDWIFDYSAGVLWFPTVDATSIPLTEVYITGYRYVGLKGLNPTFSGDVVDVLQDLTAGDFTGGYIPGWIENETRISDAIDQINRAFLDFIPNAPNSLSDFSLTMPGTKFVIDDANITLAEGFVDASGSIGNKPTAGHTVGRVAGINLETEYVGPFGNGRSGLLTLNLNNAVIGSRTLSVGSDAGVYGNLEINQDKSFGTAGAQFYEVMTARAVALNLPFGLNGMTMDHTTTGTTPTLFVVRDSSQLKPTIISTSITESATVVKTFSSGVSHYARGTRLLLGAVVDDLATDLYLDTRTVEFQTVPTLAGPNVWAFPGSYTLPPTLVKATRYNPTGVIFAIDDTLNNLAAGTIVFQTTARNANGSTVQADTKKINYLRSGTQTGISPIIETGIPVIGLGNTDQGFALQATRILLSSGQYPSADLVDGVVPLWDSSSPLPSHEAKVIGGILQASKENYGLYMPAGVDYSNHDSIQYATFMIQRKNVSQLTIEIQGRYSGLWIKLPGVSDQALIPNGWMDCFDNYVGYGTPGREAVGGCALGRAAFGGTQTLTATFGLESSAYSTNNLILVRFRLNSGDAVSGLRFSGATV